ncbi:hypothetical protein R69746_08029 [Paraburkholderia aspalathi]|nr:hypothetical protein [Paraburkholderia aspalathi]CAE6864859.1 hypothetical protein R69746_08029 [Paraburkholderia aspalathi]
MIRKGQMHDDRIANYAAWNFYSQGTKIALSIFEIAHPVCLIATQSVLS